MFCIASAVLATLRTAAVLGVDAYPVHVEVDVSHGLPGFTMVGLPDASVRESRDRVRNAIRNSGFELPPRRVTVNLAPADIRKTGTSFDLPIALGVLAALGLIEQRHVDRLLVLGELSLDGAIQPARGVLPIAAAARRHGVPRLLLPSANASEANVVSGLELLPVESLVDAVGALNDGRLPTLSGAPAAGRPPSRSAELDLADVRGQLLPRRALEIAAAGGHNLLLVGPPGAGKTMMARRLPGLLPPLSFDEALETTSIHSVAGVLPPGVGLLAERPFRAPHHSISDVALIGGGANPRPGEISLAHHGVLFLDELPEFQRRALEVLRQPLEAGCVQVARAARMVLFPARFILVASMNPCMCGYLGDPLHRCRCTPQQVQRYNSRISGPLRDRIDLIVHVPAVPLHELAGAPAGEPSAAVRQRVVAARHCQATRFRETAFIVNADLHGRALRRHSELDAAGALLLDAALRRLALSARGYDRVLKVARTIADLAGADAIEAAHLAEALQYRGAE